MSYFHLKPRYWWSYLNPFWWKQKRLVEKVLDYEYEKHKAAIDKAIEDALLYGYDL